MLSVMDSLYSSIRKDWIRKHRRIIQGLTVNNFYEILTKDCWEFGIQYETLVKNNEIMEIKLSAMKRQNIIRFQRCGMVFYDEYESFLNLLESNDVNKGIYITTGVFEFKIIRNHKKLIPSKRKVKLEDNISFFRKQIGWFGNAVQSYKAQNLKLYRYLPS